LNYGSVREIREVMLKYGIALKKRWGQNFLLSHDLRKRIAGWCDLRDAGLVWEIGPGLGSLTELLADQVDTLILFEIDWGIIKFLKDTYKERDNVVIQGGDFLDTFKAVRGKYGEPDRIVGNLPYRSASAMIAALIENNLTPPRMVFMVQRELAERMRAEPKTKEYSAFSILCRGKWKIETAGEVKPGSFYPSPDVSSVVILMRPLDNPPTPESFPIFNQLVRGAFVSRRKKIINNIKKIPPFNRMGGDDILECFKGTGISIDSRAEELSPYDFIELADCLRLHLNNI
jgi:16S rRNA (adenine1518-N6/adenine1519-N6)-dimethyltransferase